MFDQRVRKLNQAGVGTSGKYVLYWCRWNRRVQSNHALRFAAGLANQRDLPLLVLENLGCDYPYASDRLHTFVLEAAPEIEAGLRHLGIGYCFHLARRKADSKAALRRLMAKAGAVVIDDYPETVGGLPPELDVELYAVDATCIVPFRSIAERVYAAYSLRPRIRKVLPAFLKPVPPVEIVRRYGNAPPAEHTEVRVQRIPELVAECQIDHGVPPSPAFRGGPAEARRRLDVFLHERLRRYAAEKNEPAAHATSDLSPYLHFGHISSLEVGLAVRAHAQEHRLVADEFLEELIVRRELAFNFACFARRVDNLAELPDWARATVDRHRRDMRHPVHTRDEFESAATADDLWNAAQRELLIRGKIHGYYRMYWGKKILEWSRSPEDALATMIYLNDRYCLDGQDPCTYANILWCFGLHDRPWGERPVLGTIRSMSRAGMERKTDVDAYIREIEELTP